MEQSADGNSGVETSEGEVEAGRPRFVVLVGSNYSWLRRTTSHRRILEWSSEFLRDYRPVALVDFKERGETLYFWGDEARRPPRSANFLAVLERR